MTREEISRDWLLSTTPDGRRKAVRRAPLGGCHVVYGCRAEVVADSPGELQFELTAEAIKKGFIDAAAEECAS